MDGRGRFKTRIEGIVRAGNTPFAARLFFTDDDESARIALQTRPDGHFEGILPHEGPWSVQVRTPNETWYVKNIHVDVKRSPQQAVASVVVAVPGGKARGHVKSDTGEAVRGDVIVFRSCSRTVRSKWVDWNPGQCCCRQLRERVAKAR
jgi:hypothetical protein